MSTPHVEVYTKDDCSYCDRAKSLLDSKGVEYEEYRVTGDEDLFEEMVERADGRKTAPEIFVDDELVGGYDDRVTEARQDAGYQLGELADELGVDESDLLALEQGRAAQAGVGGSVVATIERFLDVELVEE